MKQVNNQPAAEKARKEPISNLLVHLKDIAKAGMEYPEGTVAGLKLHTYGGKESVWKLWFKSPKRAPGEPARKPILGKCWLSNDSKSVKGMTVAQARKAANDMWEIIHAGRDPVEEQEAAQAAQNQQRSADKAAAQEERERQIENALREERGERPLPPKGSFFAAMESWLAKKVDVWSPEHIEVVRKALTLHCEPFGEKSVALVNTDDIFELYERMAKIHATRGKVLFWCKKVFGHAIKYKMRKDACPVYEDDDAKEGKAKKQHFKSCFTVPAITELVTKMREQRTVARNASPEPNKAINFSALVAQRLENVRLAEFAEFDLNAERPTWTIPFMKLKGELMDKKNGEIKDHVVYLSTQAADIVRAQLALYPKHQYVFPGQRGTKSAMGRAAINRELYALGFKGKHSSHGFRAMFRTTCEEELHINPLLLEMVLAHKPAKKGAKMFAGLEQMFTGGNGTAYAKGDLIAAERYRDLYTERAHEVMQMWADWLDKIAAPAAPAVRGPKYGHLTLVEREALQPANEEQLLAA